MKLWTIAMGLLLPALASPPALAQQSASYMIKGAVLNSGGQPLDGAVASSPSFVLRPDALGEGAVSASLTSASYKLSAGFVQSFPTPGEVDDLVFDDIVSLSWDLEAMAGHYHVYRAGPMGAPAGVAPVGDCLLGDVTATTASDPSAPAPGRAYFYFVNAVNCIGVEGPNGTIGMGCP